MDLSFGPAVTYVYTLHQPKVPEHLHILWDKMSLSNTYVRAINTRGYENYRHHSTLEFSWEFSEVPKARISLRHLDIQTVGLTNARALFALWL